MNSLDTRSLLLTEAETLVRTLGFAAFSYADLSERVGIRKASIHHHFPTKEVLGNALVNSYLERFVTELDQLSSRRLDTRGKLLAYGDFFYEGLVDGKMPLCGALAGDIAYLPKSIQKNVERFFKVHLDWIERELRSGQVAGDILADIKPARAALQILSALQGASVIAWVLKDPSVVRMSLRTIVDSQTQ